LKTLFVPVFGGRGNQYFIVNAAIHVSSEFGFQKIVFLRRPGNIVADLADINIHWSGESAETIEKQELVLSSLFDRVLGKFINLQIRSRRVHSLSSKVVRFISQFILSLIALVRFNQMTGVFAPDNLGYSQLPNFKRSTLIVGYFQSALYGQHVRKLYKNPKCSQELYDKDNSTKILLHVRRGDYRLNPEFGILAPAYYKKILNQLLTRYKISGIDIYSDERFTDDDRASYVGELQKGIGVQIFCESDLNSEDSFASMVMGYGYYLIANSSFSYWSAIIGELAETQVHCPKPWFKNIESPRALYPSHWITVNSEFIVE